MNSRMVSILSCLASSIKAASIDDGYFTLWAFRVMNAVVAIVLEKLHQGLTIHQILGTTHGYYIYLIFLHSYPTYPIII